jgi:hypothetical protein
MPSINERNFKAHLDTLSLAQLLAYRKTHEMAPAQLAYISVAALADYNHKMDLIDAAIEQRKQAKSPAMMTLAELDVELARYGYYRRDHRTVDESLPGVRWVIISPHGVKYGASSTIAVAAIVLKLRNGKMEGNQ